MELHRIFRGRSPRAVVLALSAATLAIGSLIAAPAASAQAVSSGTFSFGGDPGDWVSGGASYSYSVAAGASITVSASAADDYVSVSVAASGDNWNLDLAAPSGKTLAAGTYTNVARWPFQTPDQAGLSLTGDGRGCNTDTGSFTISKASFGPNGYVQEFDATFTQFCDSTTASLTGSVHITSPPPPPALTITATTAADAGASRHSGSGSVSGKVTCSQPVPVTLNIALVEVAHRTIISGSTAVQVTCKPGAAVPWTATVAPTGTTPYQVGVGQVTVQANATDPNFGNNVTASVTKNVTFKKVS